MATKKTEKQTETLPATKQQKNITEKVLAQVNALRSSALLRLPKDYSPENALKGAWILLQSVTTKDGKRALDVCTTNSIALSLLNMVTEGLNPLKKQGSFIPRGNELHWEREYDGDVALAKRAGLKWIRSRCIFEGDEYVTEIDESGAKRLKLHEQPLENIDLNKIKGAYAIYEANDGVELLEMTWAQIQKSWLQGAMKGQSPAHKNFPDAMACRTVERRACKPIIRRSDDSYLENRSEENIQPGTEPPVEPEDIETIDFTEAQEIDLTPDKDKQPEQEPEPEKEQQTKPQQEGVSNGPHVEPEPTPEPEPEQEKGNSETKEKEEKKDNGQMTANF